MPEFAVIVVSVVISGVVSSLVACATWAIIDHTKLAVVETTLRGLAERLKEVSLKLEGVAKVEADRTVLCTAHSMRLDTLEDHVREIE